MHTSLLSSPSTGRLTTLRLERPLNELLDDGAVHLALRRAAQRVTSGLPHAVTVKTLSAYRATFSGCRIIETPGRLVCWRGHGDGAPAVGALARATVDVFQEDPDLLWRRTTRELVERHHPRALVEDALRAAGLVLLEVHGDEEAEAMTYVMHAAHVRRTSSRSPDRASAPAAWPAQMPTRA